MKHWYQSKTIWFNLLTALVGVATQIQSDPTIAQNAPKWIGAFAACGNIVLRLFTETAIK